jgi:hypothetical protein
MSLVFCFSMIAKSANIELVSKTTLSDKYLLRFIMSFAVTEDEGYMLPDFKAGNVKVFSKTGEAISLFGRLGRGPNDLGKPLYCKYSDKYFYFFDAGLGKILFYKKNGNAFVRSREISHVGALHDLLYVNDKLFVSGFKTTNNKEYYDFFFYDKNGRCTYILPSHIKYGLNSKEDFEKEYFKKRSLTQYSTKSYFDVQGDYAYNVWSANLRIIRINLKTNEIKTFGEKTSNYVQPYINSKVRMGITRRNGSHIKERNKMSYVWRVIATHSHIMVVYLAPEKQVFMMQFYTPDGKYIEEIPIPGLTNSRIVYDKSNNYFYALKEESVGDDTYEVDDRYYIIKYKVSF